MKLINFLNEYYKVQNISEVFTINWKIQFFIILKNYHIIKKYIKSSKIIVC